MRNKTLKMLKENKQGYLYGLRTGEDFLRYKKAKIIKSTKCVYIKIKNLYEKINIYKVKTEATDW